MSISLSVYFGTTGIATDVRLQLYNGNTTVGSAVSGFAECTGAAGHYEVSGIDILTGTPTRALFYRFSDSSIFANYMLTQEILLETIKADVASVLTDTGTDIPASIAALPTAAENRAEMDSNSTQLAAILTDTGTDIPSSISGVPTAVMDLTNGVETGITPRQALRALVAKAIGKASGGGTTSIVFRDAGNDTTDRITMTVDTDGDRSSVTLNL